MAHALCLLLDEELVALNRAVGELRRRNLPITSIAVGPGDAPGQARLTVIVDTDEVTAELLDVCDRFKATVVDESADEATVQLAGTGSFVLASVRALEGFGILEMVRSGAVALPPLASAQ